MNDSAILRHFMTFHFLFAMLYDFSSRKIRPIATRHSGVQLSSETLAKKVEEISKFAEIVVKIHQNFRKLKVQFSQSLLFFNSVLISDDLPHRE